MDKETIKQLLKSYLEIKKAKLKGQRMFCMNLDMQVNGDVTEAEIKEIKNQLKLLENK